jgi:hypothetical protein
MPPRPGASVATRSASPEFVRRMAVSIPNARIAIKTLAIVAL